ncbi:beta-lactamase family protein [Alteromonas ponticola]|uniref:Beta-lactamase family protein n=1 Tax=Alteromonas aquimaris TaxID=2998417 RepID=A0ABT3P4T1_9ALTE|nr:serine hydrolase domain-containing protein [Alteromonas aquimaris]MCW8107747.1 beta-lactamase family protein [Alteromonas aquimaris]
MPASTVLRQSFCSASALFRTLIIFKCCWVLLLANLAFADSVNDNVQQQIAKYVQEKYHEGEFHGAVLVAKNGEIIYEAGVGLANSTWGIPNATDIKYPLASITKYLTSIVINQLVASGDIELAKPANLYLREENLGLNPSITIEHLLSHRAGLADHVYDLSDQEYLRLYGNHFVPPRTIVKNMTSRPQKFKPGTSSYYSNTGFVVLGLVIESVTGKPFCQVLKSRVFAPANMHESGCLQNKEVVPRFATSYESDESKLLHVPFDHSNYSDGYAYSTPRDMLKLDIALRNEILLPLALQNKMGKARIFEPWIEEHYGRLNQLGYGYGLASWKIVSSNNQVTYTVVGHGGAGWGSTSTFWRIPKLGVVVIAFSNRSIWPFPVYEELVNLAVAN